MSRNRRNTYRSHIEWEDVISVIVGIVVLAGAATGVVALANQDWCTGVEPDGDTEQIVCPAGWQDGETRNIREDEFEGEED